MRGLLYKELCLGKKNYLTLLGITCMFSLIGFLVCLSVRCGNLKDYLVATSQKESNVAIFVYLILFFVMYWSSQGMNSVYSDSSSGWEKFTYTMPVPSKIIVAAKYIQVAGAFVIAMILAIANWYIFAEISDVEMKSSVFKNMAIIMCLGAIGYSIFLPLSFWYKNARAVANRIVIVGVGLYLVVFGAFAYNFTDDLIPKIGKKLTQIRNDIVPFSPLIIIGTLLFSYLISVKIYERREK